MNKRKLFRFPEFISKAKIKYQLALVYLVAVFIPILVIGSFLMKNSANLLTNYYQDMLDTDNLRVKTVISEATATATDVSEELAFAEAIVQLLKQEDSWTDGKASPNAAVAAINSYIYTNSELADISIITDNPNAEGFTHFSVATEEEKMTRWYQKAKADSQIYWELLSKPNRKGQTEWNLSLIRQIPLADSDYTALLIIKINDTYLQTHIISPEYTTELVTDSGQIFYSSSKDRYGQMTNLQIDYSKKYQSYSGSYWEGKNKVFYGLSTLHITLSESKVYIVTANTKAYGDITRQTTISILLIVAALVLPATLIFFFTSYFTGRVNRLRDAMRKASKEDYDIVAEFAGEDELSDAFKDLQVMVKRIQDKDAKMYAALIKEQKLLNEQQVMEMKMLASQINPHFLYNTLESIRMQALTAGNKEVANSIKMLGKSMRYVLENTGTSSITLRKELDYVENYLTIQKMRFSGRVNYSLDVEDGLDLEKYMILPLLLQPVVENAILHGLEEVEENGQIRICVATQDEYLQISIVDNGCGMDAEALAELRQKIKEQKIDTSSSIGLSNINRRIKLCYGETYGMKIDSELGKGTIITLTLPKLYN
ncbi:MAG: sensor histidine kinase [Lachnospiraceae bacterium]|nr:sensor histidine kinase [Lachnospiraceae bacterium]